MSANHSDKLLNKIVDERFLEVINFLNDPNSLLLGAKASEMVKVKSIAADLVFQTLSWDFSIIRKVNALNEICMLETHRLVVDKNNYPNKIAIHLPEMDIKVQFPINSQEGFRFAQDDLFEQAYGKKDDGTPLTVSSNRAYIMNFPIQYFNKLYTVMKEMQDKNTF